MANPAEYPGGEVTPLPPTSARTAERFTPGPVKVLSAGESSLPPNLIPSIETSGSRIPRPVPLPRPETALDRLPEPLPGYTKALREDVALEVALFGTEVQNHVLRVEGKVDRIQLTLEQQLVNVQPRAQVADRRAGDAQHVVAVPAGTADRDFFSGLMEQHLQKTAKVVAEVVEKSAKATQERLEKFETEMSGRFTKFTEEMAGKFSQLEKDVADQIRVELGSEKEKYQSTMGLYELIGELNDRPFSDDPNELSDFDRKERLSELFDQLRVTVTSPRSSLQPDVPSSLELDVPSSFEVDVPSTLGVDAPSALGVGVSSSLAASTSSTAPPVPTALSPTLAAGTDPSPLSLIQLLLQVIRVTATYIPPVCRGRPGKKE